jgi:hypothetical protein
LLKAAFSNRKMGIMLAFGFSAGLPYALLLGTLYAWLGEEGVDLETMGVFSLIGLAYAFKFLWSPIVDRVELPILGRLGRRRSWLIPIQLLLGLSFILLSQLNPQTSLGIFRRLRVYVHLHPRRRISSSMRGGLMLRTKPRRWRYCRRFTSSATGLRHWRAGLWR